MAGNTSSDKKVCVVIPLYKSFDKLSVNEKKSLVQCCHILHKHVIYIIGPSNLAVEAYRQFFQNEVGVSFNFYGFKKKYFCNVQGYSRLLLNPFFYSKFKAFEYMFICQTDGWVFSDDLVYWCNKGYDYIGAPWFEGWGLIKNAEVVKPSMIGVGNGGMSLRNIKKHKKVLWSFSYIESPEKVWERKMKDKNLLQKLVGLGYFLLNVSVTNNSFFLFNNHKGNEDGFWGIYAANNFKWFAVSNFNDALAFAFEAYPAYSFLINNKKLPFCCHAWEKYEPAFWQIFIKT